MTKQISMQTRSNFTCVRIPLLHNSSLVVDERIQDGHKNLVQLLEEIYKNSLKRKASTKSTQGLNKKERC